MEWLTNQWKVFSEGIVGMFDKTPPASSGAPILEPLVSDKAGASPGIGRGAISIGTAVFGTLLSMAVGIQFGAIGGILGLLAGGVGSMALANVMNNGTEALSSPGAGRSLSGLNAEVGTVSKPLKDAQTAGNAIVEYGRHRWRETASALFDGVQVDQGALDSVRVQVHELLERVGKAKDESHVAQIKQKIFKHHAGEIEAGVGKKTEAEVAAMSVRDVVSAVEKGYHERIKTIARELAALKPDWGWWDKSRMVLELGQDPNAWGEHEAKRTLQALKDGDFKAAQGWVEYHARHFSTETDYNNRLKKGGWFGGGHSDPSNWFEITRFNVLQGNLVKQETLAYIQKLGKLVDLVNERNAFYKWLGTQGGDLKIVDAAQKLVQAAPEEKAPESAPAQPDALTLAVPPEVKGIIGGASEVQENKPLDPATPAPLPEKLVGQAQMPPAA